MASAPAFTPAHTHAFHPLLHDVADRALDGAAADRIPGRAEGLVLYPLAIGREITGEVVHQPPFGRAPLVAAEESNAASTSSTRSVAKRSSWVVRHTAALSVPSP